MMSFRRSRLCHNWQNYAYRSYRHSGPGPESSAVSRRYISGCRIRSGM